jgi:8-oxo-dGTP pyrophosphatase MutT (NUDIX family)
MGLSNHAQYQLATKALLTKDGKILVLMTPDGYIDFPGGRVDATEVDLSWHEALRRELDEEIGTEVEVAIGQTLFVSKRTYHKNGEVKRIAAIFFACEYVSGDITLSEEHATHQWMTPNELLTTDLKYVSDDEKSQLQSYFAPAS